MYRAPTLPEPRPPRSFSGPSDRPAVLVHLEEIQKADVGRKYARKDKRPLDPPPVVHCHFRSAPNSSYPSSPSEPDVSIESLIVGAVCHVDLFPVPEECYQKYTAQHSGTPIATVPPPPSLAPRVNPALSGSYLPPQAHIPEVVPSMTLPFLLGRPTEPGHQLLHQYGRPREEGGLASTSAGDVSPIVAWLGSYPIYEGSKCTYLLAGVTFTQAELVDYNSKQAAMFVYSDLAVKAEGTFILRYRALHVSSHITSPTPFTIFAECYGGPFKIYSTKEFPGLAPSTPLTRVSCVVFAQSIGDSSPKQLSITHPRLLIGFFGLQLLSLHNVRVNIRETERKRRRKSGADSRDKTTFRRPPRRASDDDSDDARTLPRSQSPIEYTQYSSMPPAVFPSSYSASGQFRRQLTDGSYRT
ncbi:velvet factor-domain-containing protein [Lenzites betulinus]|nr:velvet factor-domain-containing protein [Lenzites betulinus]